MTMSDGWSGLPSGSPPKRREGLVEVANALDNHGRVRKNSVDAAELQRAESDLGAAVEDALNDEAVSKYLDETPE
jgi:hypothetical protein